MKVLIASAPHADTFGYSMPPPGLLRLGGALEAAGHGPLLDDLAYALASGELPADDMCPRAAERLVRRVAEEGPVGLIGLSTMGATLPAALAIAHDVRAALPGVPIVLGGPGIGGVERAVLERFPHIDAVLHGEAERTLPELLGQIQDGAITAPVPGLTWRPAPGEIETSAGPSYLRDLNELPAPAWHLLPPLSRYKEITGEDEGLVPIDSGRGCVYDCSFCSIGRYWGRRSRPLPPARLVDEVRSALALPGARNAYLCHDLFGADRAGALEFCERLSAGGPVPWEARARVDHLDPELLLAMGRAGCYRVLLGVESADPAVRARNNKATSEDLDVLACVDACAAAGITPILSLILGLPGEDDAALDASLDLCADAALRAGVNLSLHLANPQPGCALGDEFADGSEPVEGIPPDMAFGTGRSAHERALIEQHPDLFTTWNQLPLPRARLIELASMAKELPPALMRYPRTWALLRRCVAGTTRAVWTAWKASGISLEGFVRTQRNPRLDDVLAWEQAQLRAAAAGAPADHGPAPEHRPRATGEVLNCAHDLTELTPTLMASSPPPAALEPEAGLSAHLTQRSTCLLVTPAPRPGISGVRTLRISSDIARLLEGLDGTVSLADLEHTHPGVSAALTALHGRGLVSFDAPR